MILQTGYSVKTVFDNYFLFAFTILVPVTWNPANETEDQEDTAPQNDTTSPRYDVPPNVNPGRLTLRTYTSDG